MAVQTPTYWQEEEYQPLVEAKTAYGHTVQIPKLFEENWKIYTHQRETMLMYWQQGRHRGYLIETSNPRHKWAVDLQRTFLEVYKE